ncbi:MAG: NAD(P)H-dependent oxidoreductase [Bacteroidota bacterium]
MNHIAIISSSVRIGRKSDRVALYFQQYLIDNRLATVEILDLEKYDFPIFKAKLKEQKEPSNIVLEFTKKIIKADGIIIVTPEYNGGYPASLKNVIDLLYDEWHRKPIAIATVSSGIFGGSQVLTALQFTLWKMRATTVPAMFPVPNVQDAFDELGHAKNKVETDKLANLFIKELLWCIYANNRMVN